MNKYDSSLKYFVDEVNFLRKRVAQLEAENQLLKASLMQKIIDNEPSYRDLEKRFDRLSKLVFKTVKSLTLRFRRPVTNDEVIQAFRTRYPFIKAKAETITRRIRKLKEQNYLFSPKRGYYMPKLKEKEVSLFEEGV